MTEVILPSRRAVALHESFHCASLIIDGWTPQLTRIDVWADEDKIGSTRPDWDARDVNDPEAMRQLLTSVVLGPIAEAEPELDTWPISPDDWVNHGDAAMAKFICSRLDLGPYDWGLVLFRADKRRRDPRFRSLVWAIADALQERGELYQPELIEIARVFEC